jgi:subfamily B ATP-binding cassette protein MsbA
MATSSQTSPNAPRRDGDAAPHEQEHGTDFGNLWRFLAYTLPYWKHLVAGAITAIARMAMPLLMPIFLGWVIDYVLTPYLDGEVDRAGAKTELWTIVTIFGVVALLHTGVTMGRFYWPSVSIAHAIRDIRFNLYQRLQQMPLGFHQSRPTGGIVARVIADVMTAQKTIERIVIVTLQQMTRSLVIIGYLFWVDWMWALVAISTMPVFLVATRLIKARLRRASRKVAESVENLQGHMQERMAMIREVQAFTNEDHEEEYVRAETERLKDHTLKQRLLNGLLVVASELTRFGGLAVVMVFGAFRVMDRAASIGQFTTVYLYTRMLLQPLQFFANLYGQMHEAAAAADRVFEFMDMKPNIRDKPGAKQLQTDGPPEVRFDHVAFSYPGTDEQVLQDVDFVAKPGERIAVVGESGAGKSTLMNLIPRFYDVDDGAVLIDGQNVRDLTLASLREHMAIVPQEPVLFTGTIHENIEYGRKGASDEDIVDAARAANAHTFIEKLPDKYENEVGERGSGLSGGQIQRIAIARTFLKDPPILIFDEATSNLDAVSESLVMQAIDRLASGRTTFIIAHRLSTAQKADRILVMDAGRVIETGRHEDLINKKDGAYARLWHRQVGHLFEDSDEDREPVGA